MLSDERICSGFTPFGNKNSRLYSRYTLFVSDFSSCFACTCRWHYSTKKKLKFKWNYHWRLLNVFYLSYTNIHLLLKLIELCQMISEGNKTMKTLVLFSPKIWHKNSTRLYQFCVTILELYLYTTSHIRCMSNVFSTFIFKFELRNIFGCNIK